MARSPGLLGKLLGLVGLRKGRRKAREPESRRAGVLMTAVKGDTSTGPVRALVQQVIERELAGLVHVIPDPDPLDPGDRNILDMAAARRGLERLHQRGGEVLVWGTVLGPNLLSLRFTPAPGSEAVVTALGQTERLDLPMEGVSRFALVIVAHVLAAILSGRDRKPAFVRRAREVAGRLQAAAKRGDGTDPATQAALMLGCGLLRTRIGEHAGSASDLEDAAACYRSALESLGTERMPLARAMAYSHLGDTLRALGERRKKQSDFEDSVAAYRSALDELSRERAPIRWAMLQSRLGTALTAMGHRDDPATLDQAITAFHAALEELTREAAPLEWAGVQQELGKALRSLGTRTEDTEALRAAVEANQAALTVITRDNGRQLWAAAQNDLGLSLRALGMREPEGGHLEAALAAFRTALEARPADRVPLQRAATQNNIGATLKIIGERATSTVELRDAAEAFRAALEVAGDGGRLQRGALLRSLASVLTLIGEREKNRSVLEEAAATLRKALAEPASGSDGPRQTDAMRSQLTRLEHKLAETPEF